MLVTDFIILQRNILHAMPACIDYKVGSGNILYVRGVNMDDIQIEMLPVLGEFSSIASHVLLRIGHTADSSKATDIK